VQFVYAIADTYFISRIDRSSTALLSGTGLMFPVFFFIMATAGSLSVGVGTLVGRAIGEKNQDAMRHTAPSALVLALAIALPLILEAISRRSARAPARGGKMTDEALGYGLMFFRYLLPGLAVMVPLHVLFGILSGQGLTKLIATAAVLSTVINVALDPVFIFTLKMGVAGAGWRRASPSAVPPCSS